MTDGADVAGPKAGALAGDAGPIVPLPSAGPPAIAVVAGCMVLALGLFVLLEGRREHAVRTAAVHPADSFLGESAASPPPLEVPPAPPPPAPPSPAPPPAPEIRYIQRPGPPVIQYVERPAPPAPPVQNLVRLSEPALVIDNSVDAGQAQPLEDAAVRAAVLHHKATIVPQGTLILAVLETPIDSSQAGSARAITSTDTRGFDGTRVLIPRGSRLVGEYHSDTQAGQTRVLVTWTKLSRPDGVSVRLASPGADAKGEPGIPGAVNNHALARVGGMVLQSAFTVGADLASRAGSGSVIVQAPAQVVGGAGPALSPIGDEKPTITVKQGAEIAVFVAHNLDFSGALPR